MKYHPIADLFPLLDDEALQSLAMDIKENGLLEDIWTFEGMILDGRNRYRACELAGIAPRFQEYTGDTPLQFVISKNIQRRDMTSWQRAFVALEALPIYQEEAKKRMLSGKKLSVHVRSDPNQKIDEGMAMDIVARDFKTNRMYVHSAARIKADHPELIDACVNGLFKHGDFISLKHEDEGRGSNKPIAKDLERAISDLEEMAANTEVTEESTPASSESAYKMPLGAGKNTNYEWYTHEDILTYVYRFFGAIDLDPCYDPRCKVQATDHYTEKEDGLKKAWHGKVFVNPPWGVYTPKWVDKMIAEYDSGNVQEGILLLPRRSETDYFLPLYRFLWCNVMGRQWFHTPEYRNAKGELSPYTQALEETVLIYFGDRVQEFISCFQELGPIQQTVSDIGCVVKAAYKEKRELSILEMLDEDYPSVEKEWLPPAKIDTRFQDPQAYEVTFMHCNGPERVKTIYGIDEMAIEKELRYRYHKCTEVKIVRITCKG